MKSHLEMAKKYLKDPQSMRNTILCTDESKIEVSDLSTKCYVWRKLGMVHHLPNTVPIVKHGGVSIMLCEVLFSIRD